MKALCDKSGRDIKKAFEKFGDMTMNFIVNDFEKHLFEAYPQIRALKSSLYEAGALYATMTGSGSSVVGIFEKPVVLTALEKEAQVYYGV
jgi:4-diphosphocytidyl-2-C-methyl-D-erythritol kinase